jgi:hypothetical protein
MDFAVLNLNLDLYEVCADSRNVITFVLSNTVFSDLVIL